MIGSWLTRAVVLLGGTALFGAIAVHAVPDGGTAIGIWPIGLATGCLLVTSRPRAGVLAALVGLVGLLTIGPARGFDVGTGVGIGLGAETWVTWRMFARRRRERPVLHTGADQGRLILSATVGALVGGAAALLTSAVTGWGEPLVMGLAVTVANLGSQLILLPFFCRLHHRPAATGAAERAAQWLTIIVVTPVVFAPEDFPSLVFVLLPVLAWGAMRAAPFEVLAQMVVTVGVAIMMTTAGLGPFAGASSRFGLPHDAQGILLSLFLMVCALVVVPLMLAVGEQLENAHRAAAERDKVQNIVNGIANVAIIGTDELGQVTLFNPGAVRLLGYEESEVLGRSTRMLHSASAVSAKSAELGIPDDFSTVAAALMGQGAVDMPFVRKDGVERMHSMWLNRVEDDRGQVTGYVSTSEDITDRLEAERSLKEALHTERQAVERLREVDQVKDAFVSSVSHELRTPITSILGYVEMLEDGAFGDLEAPQLDAVRRVAANSSRLLSLIDDLLTLSRIQDGGLAFHDRVVDLRTVVTAGCTVVAPALERRDQVLDLRCPGEPIPFLGDRDMLERVIINLVGNAGKFSPEGGRVEVTVHTADGSAVVEVCDTGIGIPAQELDRLFSRFFRSSLAQERAIPGSGLGLSITRAIVDHHGGSIDVDSEPGVGTTFRVCLPLLTPA